MRHHFIRNLLKIGVVAAIIVCGFNVITSINTIPVDQLSDNIDTTSIASDLALLNSQLNALNYHITIGQKHLPQPTPENIQKHLATMGELKSKERERKLREAIEAGKKTFVEPVKETQTTALFIFDWFIKLAKRIFTPRKHKAIVEEIIKQEKEYFNTHYPFYHAQNAEYRIYQDLYRKLYEFFNVSGEIKNFAFLRFTNPQQFDKYHTISEFLRDEFKERGIINDNVNDTRTFILSVNLSPFGNPYIKGEATWHYFQTSLSWVKPDTTMYQTILKSFDCPTDYVDELIKLSTSIKTKEGSLFQIFIPKSKVNEHVYLSWRQGIPDNPKLLQELFTTTNIRATKINEVLGEYQKLWKSDLTLNAEVHRLFDQAITDINTGKTKISTILDQYSKDPKSLKGIEALQARILLSNDLILDPESGVVIIRYTTISEQTIEQYEQQLSEIVNKIIKQWIDVHIVKQQGSENKTRAEKLFKLVQEQTGIAR